MVNGILLRKAVKPTLSRIPLLVHASDKKLGMLESSSRRRLLMSGATCPCCLMGASCSSSSAGWYDRFLAYALAKGMGRYETAIATVKQQLFSELQSSLESVTLPLILDVGLGAGPNLQYLASAIPNAEVVGLEPNPAMRQYCLENATAVGMQQRFSFVEGVAESMPFTAAAFDAAVITLVLCSVPDVTAALSEVRRVVKPGGKVVVIEHVISPQAGTLRLQQQLLDPLQQLLAGGCHLTRDTAGALAAAGLGGGEQLKRFEVEGMWVIGPHVAGVLHV